MATLYSNADDLRNSGLVLVETQDGGGLAFTPTTTTIPSGYKDIVISGNLFSTIAGATGESALLFFNGDTTEANYRTEYHYAQGTGHGVGASNSPYFFWMRGSLSGVQATSGFTVCVPDYANSTYRAVAMCSGVDWYQPTSLAERADHGIIWIDSVAAITSILLSPATSTLAAGSSFTVWVR